MALELNLLNREDRLGAVPIVLKRGVVHNKLAVKPHGHLLANHLDAERIPRTYLVVGDEECLVGVLLVVVETARTDVPHVVGIPYLHLRSAAEVESGVAAGGENAPIDEHLKVFVILLGRKRIAAAQTIEEKGSVTHLPVLDHMFIGELLDVGGLAGLALAGLLADNRIIELLAGGHTLPVGLELFWLAIEKYGETFRALLHSARADITHLGIVREFLNADVAPLHIVTVSKPADVTFGAVKAGMCLAVRRIGTIAFELGDIGLRNENTIEIHFDLAADYANFFEVPHAGLLDIASTASKGLLLTPRLDAEVVATARDYTIDTAGVLIFVKKIKSALGVVVLAAAVIKKLKFAHGIVRGSGLLVRHTDAKTVVAVRGQAELKAEHEVTVHLFRAQIAAATLAAAVREALKDTRLLRIDAIGLGRPHPAGKILAVENCDKPLSICILANFAGLNLARLALIVAVNHWSADAPRHNGSGKSRGYNLHFYSFDKKLLHIISHFK